MIHYRLAFFELFKHKIGRWASMIRDQVELIILGSTGSIGRQTLDVVRAFPRLFKVVGLSTNRNVELLAEQMEEFQPFSVAVRDDDAAMPIKVRSDIPSWSGPGSLERLCSYDSGDIVVNALVGMAGIEPTLFALSRGKDVALANKETIVSAGALVMKMARTHKCKVIPIDSEHSAIYQCMQGENPKSINRILLTASGGPFREASYEDVRNATVEQALAHPTWNMGAKISIDSATMMNKGFEIIEAMHLFNVPISKIEVLVHPQSIVHSLVEFVDHSTLAQLGNPDMRVPIQYALMQGGMRYKNECEPLDLAKIGTLTFEPANATKFPCLRLAREAAEKGGTYPAALNAANDYLVEKFLQREIPFMSIPRWVEFVLSIHESVANYTLEDILGVRDWVGNVLDAHREYLSSSHEYIL